MHATPAFTGNSGHETLPKKVTSATCYVAAFDAAGNTSAPSAEVYFTR